MCFNEYIVAMNMALIGDMMLNLKHSLTLMVTVSQCTLHLYLTEGGLIDSKRFE